MEIKNKFERNINLKKNKNEFFNNDKNLDIKICNLGLKDLISYRERNNNHNIVIKDISESKILFNYFKDFKSYEKIIKNSNDLSSNTKKIYKDGKILDEKLYKNKNISSNLDQKLKSMKKELIKDSINLNPSKEKIKNIIYSEKFFEFDKSSKTGSFSIQDTNTTNNFVNYLKSNNYKPFSSLTDSMQKILIF